MKTRVQMTKSGKGALITVLESDEEIAERQRLRRERFAAERKCRCCCRDEHLIDDD